MLARYQNYSNTDMLSITKWTWFWISMRNKPLVSPPSRWCIMLRQSKRLSNPICNRLPFNVCKCGPEVVRHWRLLEGLLRVCCSNTQRSVLRYVALLWRLWHERCGFSNYNPIGIWANYIEANDTILVVVLGEVWFSRGLETATIRILTTAANAGSVRLCIQLLTSAYLLKALSKNKTKHRLFSTKQTTATY